MKATTYKRWDMMVHERGHYLHVQGGTGMYGMTHEFKIFESVGDENKTQEQYFTYEMVKTNVTYLADVNTLCNESNPVTTGYGNINTCVQEYIQEKIGCRLPWLPNTVSLPYCDTEAQKNQYFRHDSKNCSIYDYMSYIYS